jgi:hypothetical protein
MTTPCDTQKSSPCDCPQMAEPGHANEPGLPAISYRLGTHATFFQRMLGRLHTNAVLREKLTTRTADDPAIALLDAWAMVGDVLTFYQERIANEAYLRTATERRSVLEMARTIGYELNPGVAAGVYLAFTVDDTTKQYAKVTIPEGTQVQSLPAQGKLPQTFETSQQFQARAEWNTLKPRQTRHQTLGIKDGALYVLAPTNNGGESPNDFSMVNPDDYLQDGDKVTATKVNTLYLSGIANKLQNGDLILLAGINSDGNCQTLIRTIVSIELDKELNRTVVQLTGESEQIHFMITDLIPIASIFTGLSFNATEIKQNVLGANISEKMMNALIGVNRWDHSALLEHVSTVQTTAGALEAKQGVFAFREHVGFFGNNAPAWSSLPASQRYDTYWVKHEDGTGNWVNGEPVYGKNWDENGWEIWKKYPDKKEYSITGADVYLERKVDGIGKESWALFNRAGEYTAFRVNDTRDESITGFSLSGKSTGLILRDENGGTPIKSDFKVRNTTAHVKSECIELALLPIEDDLEEEQTNKTKTGVTQVMLGGMVLGLQAGQPVIINGEQVDAGGVECHEVTVLKDIIHNHGYTVLYFQEALQYRYVRDTVTIHANVVPATHGETIKEVLGSGDGTRTNQRFVLKKPPLTYVSASTTSGSESTLKVKVDGVEWEEVSSLYGLNDKSRSYIVRLDNDGKVGVKFGDGKQGGRLPSGMENVTAAYRSGIGFDGEVDAESLILLKTRPLGIRSVTNPIAAGGADEPETMDTARTNAPLTVLTMDRIVSLTDYEDFARAFTGIGKAKAIVLWNGETDLVHITIASAKGNTIGDTSGTYRNLVKAIDTYRNPLSKVQVDTFDLRLFHIDATVLIDERYTTADVLAGAESSLQYAFSFERRDFGQPVTAAEVIHTIQQIPGIVYVDLEKLYLTDDATGPDQTGPASFLTAINARWPKGENLQLAQLLLINPVGIKLEEIKS